MDVVQPDKKKSSYQLELERRANDILRIYNPTSERYVIEWDRKGGTKLFPVEAKSEAVYPRYIAKKYIKEMFQKILNDRAKEAILAENKRRIEGGMAEMDKTMKTNEQMAFEEKFYNPTNEEAKRIIALLYLGVESEYGIDRQAPMAEQKMDNKPIFDRALDEIQEEKGVSSIDKEKTSEIASSKATEEISGFPCELCTFVSKSNIGLISHKRTHRKKLENKDINITK
ncbi:MAG: hypothetical protein ACYSWS_03435 [Planctomycetota bacterium]|jgi:hypothetical protein